MFSNLVVAKKCFFLDWVGFYQNKTIFNSKSPSTAPGDDGLMNGVLAKSPSVHQSLQLITLRHMNPVLLPPNGLGVT